MTNDFPDFHFIAIGGVGQSALAKILLKLGYKVSGSDIEDSKYVKLVKSLGARVYIKEHLQLLYLPQLKKKTQNINVRLFLI